MTPGARIAAAAAVLDDYLAGTPAEKALTNWARRSRFAGSGDRAAVRDHVFTSLRNLRSHAALGGAMTGRGLMLGALRAAGEDPRTLFTGEGYAPAPVTEEEARHAPVAMTEGERLDCPDWLLPTLRESLGAESEPVLTLLKTRAPVFLRVNRRKTGRDGAMSALAEERIVTRPHDLSKNALEVVENARGISKSRAYREGLVELQDAGSQWVTDHVPVRKGARVLDYCAGGGGKTLALAGRAEARFHAHDADFRRMSDIPARAGRAGVEVDCLQTEELAVRAPYDLVLCDVPCSGSGAWRRAPAGKWALTEERLAQLVKTQARILREAAPLVVPGGVLAYVTCSLLNIENDRQVTEFIRENRDWRCTMSQALSPLRGGDGFYLALIEREGKPA